MSNVLGELTQQQVLALGRRGWSLRARRSDDRVRADRRGRPPRSFGRATVERRGRRRRQRREQLRGVLTSVDWNTGRAAAVLGVDRTTVYRRMNRLGITPPRAARH